jgi:hypothetical protein
MREHPPSLAPSGHARHPHVHARWRAWRASMGRLGVRRYQHHPRLQPPQTGREQGHQERCVSARWWHEPRGITKTSHFLGQFRRGGRDSNAFQACLASMRRRAVFSSKRPSPLAFPPPSALPWIPLLSAQISPRHGTLVARPPWLGSCAAGPSTRPPLAFHPETPISRCCPSSLKMSTRAALNAGAETKSAPSQEQRSSDGSQLYRGDGGDGSLQLADLDWRG